MNSKTVEEMAAENLEKLKDLDPKQHWADMVSSGLIDEDGRVVCREPAEVRTGRDGARFD
jgi:hypothetical protein